MLVNLYDESAELLLFLVTASLLKLSALRYLRKKVEEGFESVGRVQAIYHYPIKSCAAIKCQQANAETLGLNYEGILDRHWMVVRRGVMLNQKHIPKIALVKVAPLGQGNLQLDAPDMPSLPILMDKCKSITTCKMDDKKMEVIDCGDAAATWMMTFLKDSDLRLVHSPSHLTKRNSTEKLYGWEHNTKIEDLIAFSKFTSYMIASASSLADLNSRLETPVSMLNFRPNITVETDEGVRPFDEDTWQEVKIGDGVHFRVCDLCKRCPAVTVDPTTGEMSKVSQPLATLNGFRFKKPYNSGIFGLQCAVEIPGKVKVGDEVKVIRGHPKT